MPGSRRVPLRCKYASLEEWFWDCIVTQGECKVWIGAKHGGYGHFFIGKKEILAHRYAMELRLGHPIPKGKQVNHSCDNPPCVIHTYLGTQTENIADMDRRMRRSRTPGGRKLTSEQILEIRGLAGVMGKKEIASIFNVDYSTISSIILRKSWAWVEDEERKVKF